MFYPYYFCSGLIYGFVICNIIIYKISYCLIVNTFSILSKIGIYFRGVNGLFEKA